MDDYNEFQLQNMMNMDDLDLESLLTEEYPQETELPTDLLDDF